MIITHQEFNEQLTLVKINWLGTQKDLAELILSLVEKGFISYPPDESLPNIARRYAGILDFSSSENKPETNKAANLITYFRPAYNTDLKKMNIFFRKITIKENLMLYR